MQVHFDLRRLDLVSHQPQHVAHDGVEIVLAEGHFPLSDEAAQALDHLTGAFALARDLLQGFAHQRLIRVAAAEHAQTGRGMADDGRQRLIDLVRKAGRHLAERGQPGGVRQVIEPAAPFRLHRLTVGNIASDAGEQQALRQMHRPHREVHRKHRAVLAQAFDLAADADDPGLPGRQIVLNVLVMIATIGLRHQQPDVVPDHLVGGIAEHPLGGMVETLDDAAIIDGDDAVHRRIQNRPVAFQSFGQRGGVLGNGRAHPCKDATALPAVEAAASLQSL